MKQLKPAVSVTLNHGNQNVGAIRMKTVLNEVSLGHKLLKGQRATEKQQSSAEAAAGVTASRSSLDLLVASNLAESLSIQSDLTGGIAREAAAGKLQSKAGSKATLNAQSEKQLSACSNLQEQQAQQAQKILQALQQSPEILQDQSRMMQVIQQLFVTYQPAIAGDVVPNVANATAFAELSNLAGQAQQAAANTTACTVNNSTAIDNARTAGSTVTAASTGTAIANTTSSPFAATVSTANNAIEPAYSEQKSLIGAQVQAQAHNQAQTQAALSANVGSALALKGTNKYGSNAVFAARDKILSKNKEALNAAVQAWRAANLELNLSPNGRYALAMDNAQEVLASYIAACAQAQTSFTSLLSTHKLMGVNIAVEQEPVLAGENVSLAVEHEPAAANSVVPDTKGDVAALADPSIATSVALSTADSTASTSSAASATSSEVDTVTTAIPTRGKATTVANTAITAMTKATAMANATTKANATTVSNTKVIANVKAMAAGIGARAAAGTRAAADAKTAGGAGSGSALFVPQYLSAAQVNGGMGTFCGLSKSVMHQKYRAPCFSASDSEYPRLSFAAKQATHGNAALHGFESQEALSLASKTESFVQSQAQMASAKTLAAYLQSAMRQNLDGHLIAEMLQKAQVSLPMQALNKAVNAARNYYFLFTHYEGVSDKTTHALVELYHGFYDCQPAHPVVYLPLHGAESLLHPDEENELSDYALSRTLLGHQDEFMESLRTLGYLSQKSSKRFFSFSPRLTQQQSFSYHVEVSGERYHTWRQQYFPDFTTILEGHELSLMTGNHVFSKLLTKDDDHDSLQLLRFASLSPKVSPLWLGLAIDLIGREDLYKVTANLFQARHREEVRLGQKADSRDCRDLGHDFFCSLLPEWHDSPVGLALIEHVATSESELWSLGVTPKEHENAQTFMYAKDLQLLVQYLQGDSLGLSLENTQQSVKRLMLLKQCLLHKTTQRQKKMVENLLLLWQQLGVISGNLAALTLEVVDDFNVEGLGNIGGGCLLSLEQQQLLSVGDNNARMQQWWLYKSHFDSRKDLRCMELNYPCMFTHQDNLLKIETLIDAYVSCMLPTVYDSRLGQNESLAPQQQQSPLHDLTNLKQQDWLYLLAQLLIDVTRVDAANKAKLQLSLTRDVSFNQAQKLYLEQLSGQEQVRAAMPTQLPAQFPKYSATQGTMAVSASSATAAATAAATATASSLGSLGKSKGSKPDRDENIWSETNSQYVGLKQSLIFMQHKEDEPALAGYALRSLALEQNMKFAAGSPLHLALLLRQKGNLPLLFWQEDLLQQEHKYEPLFGIAYTSYQAILLMTMFSCGLKPAVGAYYTNISTSWAYRLTRKFFPLLPESWRYDLFQRHSHNVYQYMSEEELKKRHDAREERVRTRKRLKAQEHWMQQRQQALDLPQGQQSPQDELLSQSKPLPQDEQLPRSKSQQQKQQEQPPQSHASHLSAPLPNDSKLDASELKRLPPDVEQEKKAVEREQKVAGQESEALWQDYLCGDQPPSSSQNTKSHRAKAKDSATAESLEVQFFECNSLRDALSKIDVGMLLYSMVDMYFSMLHNHGLLYEECCVLRRVSLNSVLFKEQVELLHQCLLPRDHAAMIGCWLECTAEQVLVHMRFLQHDFERKANNIKNIVAGGRKVSSFFVGVPAKAAEFDLAAVLARARKLNAANDKQDPEPHEQAQADSAAKSQGVSSRHNAKLKTKAQPIPTTDQIALTQLRGASLRRRYACSDKIMAAYEQQELDCLFGSGASAQDGGVKVGNNGGSNAGAKVGNKGGANMGEGEAAGFKHKETNSLCTNGENGSIKFAHGNMAHGQKTASAHASAAVRATAHATAAAASTASPADSAKQKAKESIAKAAVTAQEKMAKARSAKAQHQTEQEGKEVVFDAVIEKKCPIRTAQEIGVDALCHYAQYLHKNTNGHKATAKVDLAEAEAAARLVAEAEVEAAAKVADDIKATDKASAKVFTGKLFRKPLFYDLKVSFLEFYVRNLVCLNAQSCGKNRKRTVIDKDLYVNVDAYKWHATGKSEPYGTWGLSTDCLYFGPQSMPQEPSSSCYSLKNRLLTEEGGYQGAIDFFLAATVYQSFSVLGFELFGGNSHNPYCHGRVKHRVPSFELFLYTLEALEKQEALCYKCLCGHKSLVFNPYLGREQLPPQQCWHCQVNFDVIAPKNEAGNTDFPPL